MQSMNIFLAEFGIFFLIILAEKFGLLCDAAENKKIYKYFVKKLKIGENRLVVRWLNTWHKKATTHNSPKNFSCVA